MPDNDKDNTKNASKKAGKDKVGEHEEVAFVLAVIKTGYDFQKVAEICSIKGTDGKPSKGAANKRWSRLLGKHNLTATDLKAGATSSSGPASPSKRKTPAKDVSDGDAEDEEVVPATTPKKMKRATKGKSAPETKAAEVGGTGGGEDNTKEGEEGGNVKPVPLANISKKAGKRARAKKAQIEEEAAKEEAGEDEN